MRVEQKNKIEVLFEHGEKHGLTRSSTRSSTHVPGVMLHVDHNMSLGDDDVLVRIAGIRPVRAPSTTLHWRVRLTQAA